MSLRPAEGLWNDHAVFAPTWQILRCHEWSHQSVDLYYNKYIQIGSNDDMLGEATDPVERSSEYLIHWLIFGHHQFHAEIHSSSNKEEGVIAEKF